MTGLNKVRKKKDNYCGNIPHSKEKINEYPRRNLYLLFLKKFFYVGRVYHFKYKKEKGKVTRRVISFSIILSFIVAFGLSFCRWNDR